MRRLALCLLLAAGCGNARKSDEPYTPEREDEVLETLLRGRSNDVPTQKIAALSRKLASHPADVATAVALAQLHVSEARRTSDPRQLGYAQAALAHFWDQSAAPADVLRLRATILQTRHEYPAALSDWDRVLALAPHAADAVAARAMVLMALARYEQSACVACDARVAGITGHAPAAFAQLIAAAPAAHATLGELAWWSGDDAAAEREWRAAIASDDADDASRAALADLMLATKREKEVTPLVESRIDNDAMIVRAYLAAKVLDPKRAAELAVQTRDRFVASHVRGDIIHERDEARFELADGHAALATKLALHNWAASKEPEDARVLLAAAVSAHDPAAAAPALRWLDATHFADARMNALVAAARVLK